MSSQASGAQRRLCWMQRRLRRKSGTPTEHRPPSFDGRCRADYAFGAPFVPNGGMTSVSSQASGAKRRLCWMQRRLQPTRCASPSWQAAAKMGRLRRSAPTLGFSMGAAAPITRSAPPSFQMVGMARRRRPKIQARSGVSAGCKGGFAAKVGADGASPSKFRWALPRRLRVRRPPSFQMVGMARRRRPKIQARSAVCEEYANSNALPNKGGFAAKVGADGASPSRF